MDARRRTVLAVPGLTKKSAPAAVQAAIEAGESGRLLALLDEPALQGTAAIELRHGLWHALVMKARPGAEERFIRGLFEEARHNAHLIWCYLFKQPDTAPLVLEALPKLYAAGAIARTQLHRAVAAVRDWPDFVYPDGYLERQPPPLRLLLQRPADRIASAPATAESIARDLSALLDSPFPSEPWWKLPSAPPAKERPLYASALEAVRPRLMRELREGVGGAERQAALIELLTNLGEPAASLSEVSTLLPPAPAARATLDPLWDTPEAEDVRFLRTDAQHLLATFEEDRRFFRLDAQGTRYDTPEPADAHFDWLKTTGVYRRGDDWVVLSERGGVSLWREGERVWRTATQGKALLLEPTRPEARDLVLFSDKHGLHCLDVAKGKERWCNVLAEGFVFSGQIGEHLPLADFAEDGLYVLTPAALWKLRWEDGVLEAGWELPFFALCLDRTPEGLWVRDRERVLDDTTGGGALLDARGGLVPHRASPLLATAVRELDGVRVEIGRGVLTVDGSRSARLPERVTRVGPLLRGGADGSPVLLVFRQGPDEALPLVGAWCGLALP